MNCDFGKAGRHWGEGPFGRGFERFMGMFGGPAGGFPGGRGFRAARMLSSEDLQLIILLYLNEKPRHGYEIIKALEEQSSGLYTPSPGVVYPALTYLEETNYAGAQSEGNKKLYNITDQGRAFLEQHKAVAEEMMEHLIRFGKKMARMRRHFAEEEAELDPDLDDARKEARGEMRESKFEIFRAAHELMHEVRSRLGESKEDNERVLDVIRRAIQDVRKK
jgi:DNA-binding PadR family transcriptional regulator